MLDDSLADIARGTKGFRGNLTLLSKDDPDVGVVITIWENEEALEASLGAVFQESIKKIAQFVVSPPEVKNYRVFTAELRALSREKG